MVPETNAYRRIAAELRAAIESGDLPSGAKLPSITALIDRFRVSRTTVVSALDLLRVEGLTEHRHGVGVFVRRFSRIVRNSPDRLTASRWRAGEAIQDLDTGARRRTVSVEVRREDVPVAVADAFGAASGSQAVARHRRFDVDGRTVQVASSYLPLDLAGGTRMEEADSGPGGIYARLAELGVGPTEFEERVVVRRPSSDEVRDLGLPTVGVEVIEVTRYAYAAGGRCVEVNRMVLDASAYELRYRFPA
ncbi:GntR family transcriptional regulator [Asanoa hainanensis]|uniref:GntR family transcriptional regulator n=1 Tax=Asanoa hainanensis TaxID=560556 RepID=A0A239IYH4_9ACTN|nr:GntR family transcriptional regulator [Asanoa hainanensis]SNS98258.1 GntR family transcriptional regulator [Asanoa hainanensis]